VTAVSALQLRSASSGDAGDLPRLLVPERVLAHTYGADRRHPQGALKSCVVSLGQSLSRARAAGLALGQIEAARLEKLPAVCEAAQIARLGHDHESDDRADVEQLAQALVVEVRRKQRVGLIASLERAGIGATGFLSLRPRRRARGGWSARE